MKWTVEYRQDFPVGKRYELKEGTAHRGAFESGESAIHAADVPAEQVETIGWSR